MVCESTASRCRARNSVHILPHCTSHLARCCAPTVPAPLLSIVGATVYAARWTQLHCYCLLMIALLASTLQLPLLAVATVASAADVRASSTGTATSAPVPAPLQPHIVLLSIPWRGHLTPLLNVARRLVARGIHVSVGAATAGAHDYIKAQLGDSVDIFRSGHWSACALVKRQREQQPHFASTDGHFSAEDHPGAQLTDMYAAPSFAFQDLTALTAGGGEASGSPNGVALLMRTFASFQSCMQTTLAQSIATLMDPLRYEERIEQAKLQLRADGKKVKGGKAKERKAREAALLEKEKALQLISVPKLVVVDRFTWAGFDVAELYNLTYVVNNPQLLLDLDSPSFSLPAPWSYLPAQPPLSLWQRLSNLLHRFNYRATASRALESVNANRALINLPPIDSWSHYFSSHTHSQTQTQPPPLILTNTVWGIELHRSSDAQGMQSFRNANPAMNGFTPRFRMTGPLLPCSGGNTSSEYQLFSPLAAASPSMPGGGRSATLASLSMPTYDAATLFIPSLRHFMTSAAAAAATQQQQEEAEGRRGGVIYINLGDGEELTFQDMTALLEGLDPFIQRRFSVVMSLPAEFQLKLLITRRKLPDALFVADFIPQFEFLAHYSRLQLLSLVITHGSLANVQESFAAGLPVLLLPHPTVDQMEVAGRLLRTKAVRVIQRVQLNSSNLQESLTRMLDDHASEHTHKQRTNVFIRQ